MYSNHKRVPFFEMDLSVDENRPTGNRFGVKGYPTMKVRHVVVCARCLPNKAYYLAASKH